MMDRPRVQSSTSSDSRQSRAVPSPVSVRAAPVRKRFLHPRSRAVPRPVFRDTARTTSPDHRPNWLCIAYSFPPIARSGTHRTLGFVRHLDTLGFDATILTITPLGEATDRALLERVPPGTRVLRTPWWDIIPAIKRACRLEFLSRRQPAPGLRDSSAPPTHTIGAPNHSFKDWLTRLLITPDSRIGWLIPAVVRGLREIKRRRPSVIYSTSPCMTAHLIGLILSKLTRIPWVADFRDPWRDNPFRDMRYPSLELIDARLERAVLRSADHIVAATPTLRDLLVRRMPEIERKCSTILNGFDAPDFDGVTAKRMCPADHVVLTHCGEFYGPRRPDGLFAAVASVLASQPHLRAKLHLLLVGGSAHDGRSLRSIAEAKGLGECVEVLGRRDHREAIALMKGSDALFLAGQSGPGGSLQVPNKLYEYIALQRPIIAAVHLDNPAVDVLREAHAEAIVTGPDDEDALADAVRRVAAGDSFEVEKPWSGVGRFERARRAEQLADVFGLVSHIHPDPHASACAAPPDPLDSKAKKKEPTPIDPLPVSVIVPVSGDMGGLGRTLAALAEQTRPPSEVIVAPQDNPSKSLSVLNERVRLYPFARVVTGKRCNPADARNRAIRVARHERIACTEAGCIPEKTWLERITAPLANHRIDVVGGMCEARGQTAFERLVGLMTGPSGDRPRDPLRFNPGAKSMALRASAWRRAGGFPNWLDGDDDTLFALRLRSMNPPVGFAVAVDAVVSDRPPKTPKMLFRTRFAKACGEAQTGRGTKARRNETLRYTGILLMMCAAVVCGVYVGTNSAGMCVVAALTVLAWPHHRRARRTARRMKSTSCYVPAVIVAECAALAEWLGRWAGCRDRRNQPDVFIDRLDAYMGSESADLSFHPWCLAAAPVPRTLVITWHWPPTNDPGANTLANVLATGPTSGFRVLTRHTRTSSHAPGSPLMNADPGHSTGFQPVKTSVAPASSRCEHGLEARATLLEHAPRSAPPFATHYVDWPLATDGGKGFWQRFAQWRTVRAMIRRADQIADRRPLDRVMCIAANPVTLLTAWRIARRLDVPFVPMFCGVPANEPITRAEPAGLTRRIIERITLTDAWMVIAESTALADHLRRHGIERVCNLPTAQESTEFDHRLHELLRRLITGAEPLEPRSDTTVSSPAHTRDSSARHGCVTDSATPRLERSAECTDRRR